MTMKCSKAYGPTLDEGSVEHGVTDRLGRSVGYQWRIREVVYAEIVVDPSRGHYSYYPREIGHPMRAFELWGSPTRDGKRYGPAFNHTEFPTLEQARRDAVRRVEQARKRDTKKFAKVPA